VQYTSRAFEAANAGALIFQEEGNRELPEYFRDRRECVYYRQDNLEELTEYYLEHEDERRALAQAAALQANAGTFENFWQEEVERIERDWPPLRDAAGRARLCDPGRELRVRAWQALTSGRVEDTTLVAELERACQRSAISGQQPANGNQHSAVSGRDAAEAANLAGCMLWRQGRGRMPAAALGHVAGEMFRRALAAEPGFVVAGLNLAETLDGAGRRPEALEVARQTLDLLRRAPELDPASVDAMPLCQAFDAFHVEWERAGWKTVGDRAAEAQAKRDLILWKLHGLLASGTGELAHYYEAALRGPELPGSRAGLGDALVRAGRPEEAVEHLRRALAANPFDRDLARGCFQVLTNVNDAEERRRLVEHRRLLARAAPQVVAMENWFADPRPRGDELVSIIILCCNQVDATRACLESLLRHTRPPYELLLVDNGSSDGTGEYLASIDGEVNHRDTKTQRRVVVIRNETNLGFPRGCNQALERARGKYVVFLNNDTVLTPGWLDGLVALALHDWPHVGMVGPVTNGAPAPQGIVVAYEGLDGLDAFAARRRREFGGKMMQVLRLTGFCLLMRREVLDRLGRLDERFGIGFFEDDDLCLRAREAGYRLLMAQDVFVHHAGNRTFNSLNLDLEALLRANFEILKEKWGTELTAGYYLPERRTEDKVAGAPAGKDAYPTNLPMPIQSGDGTPQSKMEIDLTPLNRRLFACDDREERGGEPGRVSEVSGGALQRNHCRGHRIVGPDARDRPGVRGQGLRVPLGGQLWGGAQRGAAPCFVQVDHVA
jgi:GT2 family glycosyltransferase/tetratricopeptide (TPR) repeat protein